MLHSLRFTLAVLGMGTLMTACGQQVNSAPVAGNSAATPVVATDSYDINALIAAADPAKGQIVFLQCRACHSLEAGGPNKVGPNLHGVIGRKAGLAPGFSYSDQMTASGVVWSAETLDKFLLRPSDFIPGTRMVFVGLRKPEDRANVIAYLKQETGAAQ
ncbi:MAG: cytochrome c family protein [Gammaproteobacteria bacterium]